MSEPLIFRRAISRTELENARFLDVLIWKGIVPDAVEKMRRAGAGTFPLLRCCACGQHMGRVGWAPDEGEEDEVAS